MLAQYAILMGTLLLLQMAVAVSAYMTRGVAEDATTQVIEDQYLQLKIDSNIGEIIDRLQTHVGNGSFMVLKQCVVNLKPE